MGCLFVWKDLGWHLALLVLLVSDWAPLQLSQYDIGTGVGVLTSPTKIFRIFVQSFLEKGTLVVNQIILTRVKSVVIDNTPMV